MEIHHHPLLRRIAASSSPPARTATACEDTQGQNFSMHITATIFSSAKS